MSTDHHYTRDDLISICEAAVVPHAKWHDRDSASAQQGVGKAWALLRAGCEFRILHEGTLRTDDRTIWVEFDVRDFNYFELGDMGTVTVYLPTRDRLADAAGRDWY